MLGPSALGSRCAIGYNPDGATMRILSFLILAGGLWAQGDGWTDITPDASFQQWTRISIPPGKAVSQPSQWKLDAAAGTLVCEGNGGHEMLRYNTPYKNVVLHVEWKFTKLPDENAKYNSGVFIRNDAEGAIWHQAQTGRAGGYLFGNTPVNGVVQRFNLMAQMVENRVKPAGEWNTYDITAKGRTITLSVNGKVVNEYTETEVLEGYVALEAEGYRIEFRNVRVKPLL
jgi:hypothetical protein